MLYLDGLGQTQSQGGILKVTGCNAQVRIRTRGVRQRKTAKIRAIPGVFRISTESPLHWEITDPFYTEGHDASHKA